MNKDSRKARKLQPRLQLKNITFSKDASFTVQNAIFDRSSKKLILEKTHSKNKRKFESEFDFKCVAPYRIARIHKATGDALEVLVDDMETKNMILKERIKELEYTLMSPPIFSTPVSMVNPG